MFVFFEKLMLCETHEGMIYECLCRWFKFWATKMKHVRWKPPWGHCLVHNIDCYRVLVGCTALIADRIIPAVRDVQGTVKRSKWTAMRCMNSIIHCLHTDAKYQYTQITKFLGPTWGPPRSRWPQMGPMLAPWTLLSGICIFIPEPQWV